MKTLDRWLCPFLLLMLAACEGVTAPQMANDNSLTMLRFAPGAPPPEMRQASVWAVKGRDTELVIHYSPEEPGEEGEELLRFSIPANSLLRAPNGQLFAQGDSVRITVTIDQAERFRFDFEPSGLVFDPDHPAKLEINYRYADPDRNGDGQVNEEDAHIDDYLCIWQQEQPGQPWFRLPTNKFGEYEVKAKVKSFTGFAVAS